MLTSPRIGHLLLAIMSAAAIGAAGCKTPGAQSTVSGHFEDSDATKNAQFDGKLMAVPEYKPIEAVIISLPLLRTYAGEGSRVHQGLALMRAILASGADIWMLVDTSGENNARSELFNLGVTQQEMARMTFIPTYKPQSAYNNAVVWSRDFAPMPAIDQNGELVLVDQNYYPDRPIGDAEPLNVERKFGLKRVSLPVYNEGGNFMVNDDLHCLMTTRVIDANVKKHIPSDQILNGEQISNLYRRFGGCAKVSIMERMPYDKTGHIDIWGKFLTNDMVIVGEIPDAAMPFIPPQQTLLLKKTKEIKKYLDARAAEITAMGYEVVRIPMPLPSLIPGSDLMVIRPYTNSLTVNGNVIVPDYVASSEDNVNDPSRRYLDASLLPKHRQRVREIYAAAGFKTQFLRADKIITNFGAIHCITMQVPKANKVSAQAAGPATDADNFSNEDIDGGGGGSYGDSAAPGPQQPAFPAPGPLPGPQTPGGGQTANGMPIIGVSLVQANMNGSLMLRIKDVRPNTPASKADLRPGDYILNLNGRPVRSLQEYDSEVARVVQAGGREFKIHGFANGKEFETTVRFN